MMNFIKKIFKDVPLGMNLRNAVIRKYNSREALMLAKDKSASKKKFENSGILVPKTYCEIITISEMILLNSLPSEFVIKPNLGMAGRGILVLKKKDKYFESPSGEKFTLKDVKIHIHGILDGEYSGHAEKDKAIIEERVYPSSKIMFKDSAGLPDIRIICFYGKPILSMMRYSTKKSDGKANLAAGALGIGIDLDTGRINNIHSKNEKKRIGFVDLEISESFVVPKWEEMKEIANKAAEISGLVLCGVDLILDQSDKVMVLEINGRPGIEIQNINEKSMFEEIKKNDCIK